MPRQVQFILRCKEVAIGSDVRVAGNCKALGLWSPESAALLWTSPNYFPIWRSSVQEIGDDEVGNIEYKYVICTMDGHAEKWEECENRVLPLSVFNFSSKVIVSEMFNVHDLMENQRFSYQSAFLNHWASLEGAPGESAAKARGDLMERRHSSSSLLGGHSSYVVGERTHSSSSLLGDLMERSASRSSFAVAERMPSSSSLYVEDSPAQPLLTAESILLAEEHGQAKGNEGATASQTMFNLVKNIVGAGVLSLPSGIAAGTGLVPAILITVVLGLYSAWTFSKIGEMCDRNDAFTFTQLGEKVRGKGFAKILGLTCTIKTFFSCLVYSLVICDSWTQILAGGGFNVTRNQVLLGMTLLVLLPLCLVENLSVLSYTSLLGSGGMLFTLWFMFRRFFDESYNPGGHFYNSVSTQLHPNFEGAPGLFAVKRFQTLTLVSLLSTAFIAHYNAPKFYEQVADRTPSRFRNIVGVSFVIAIVIFVAFMVVGYKTFGTNSNGLILNNYSPVDPLATAARTAISTSIILTYPLAFTGLRDGVAGLLGNQVNRTSLTIGLLTFITGIASVVTDVGFVNALQGAILGSALIYFFPGMIQIFYAEKMGLPTVCIAEYTALLGAVLGVCGATVTIVNTYY